MSLKSSNTLDGITSFKNEYPFESAKKFVIRNIAKVTIGEKGIKNRFFLIYKLINIIAMIIPAQALRELVIVTETHRNSKIKKIINLW